VVIACFSVPAAAGEPCAASPVAPPPAINTASAAPAALLLLNLTNRSFLFIMAFLQKGFATSHPQMLKVKVGFKSSAF
jgi:hypothetical protein